MAREANRRWSDQVPPQETPRPPGTARVSFSGAAAEVVQVEAAAEVSGGEEPDGDEESDEDSEEESDEDPAEAGTLDEAKRHHKRERVAARGIRLLFQQRPDGFPLGDLPSLLESVKVRNFAPELCGYSSLELFASHQPPDLLQYDASQQMLRPPA